MHAPTDETLMLAYAGGDAEAFTELYSRHRARLFHYLLGQLRDRPLAEELFQDVWQKMIQARAGWKPDAAFTTWLFRIAHNRLNDHWRIVPQHRTMPTSAPRGWLTPAPPNCWPTSRHSGFSSVRPWPNCHRSSRKSCCCDWNRN